VWCHLLNILAVCGYVDPWILGRNRSFALCWTARVEVQRCGGAFAELIFLCLLKMAPAVRPVGKANSGPPIA